MQPYVSGGSSRRQNLGSASRFVEKPNNAPDSAGDCDVGKTVGFVFCSLVIGL